jgi:O-antigen/teichoic acid export membrane protein
LSLGRNTVYNLAGGVIPTLCALITVPIYVKLIGPSRYGVLAIAWLLLGYFGLFDLGLGRATSFRIAFLKNSPPAARADTFWAAVVVNLMMGLIGGAVLWLAAGYFFAHMFKVQAALRPEIVAAVPLLAASVPIATLAGVLTGALQGREKFLGVNIVSVTWTLLFQILPLGVVWRFGPNIVQILAAALTARLCALAVVAYMCHAEITRGSPIRLARSEIPHLLGYGGWVTVTALMSPLLVIVDRFAIGAVLGAEAVAAYTIPYQPAKQIQLFPAALTSALFPRISAASPEARRKYARNATLTVMSLVTLPVLGGIFIAEPALRLWVGASLGARSAPVGRILLIGFWINALALIPFTNLQASGRPDRVAKILMLEIPPYFLVLYIGLTFFGVPGAAVAFCFRYAMDYGLLSWFSARRFPGAGLIAVNLALLVVGAYLSSLWPITSSFWWISAAAVGLPTLAAAWWTLPEGPKHEILSRLPRWARKAAVSP